MLTLNIPKSWIRKSYISVLLSHFDSCISDFDDDPSFVYLHSWYLIIFRFWDSNANPTERNVTLSLCTGLHEMERRFICEAAPLDGSSTSGKMPWGSRYAIQLAHSAIRLLSEKRLPLTGPSGCGGWRYSRIDARFPSGTAIRALFVIAMLRRNRQRSWSSFGSLTGKSTSILELLSRSLCYVSPK